MHRKSTAELQDPPATPPAAPSGNGKSKQPESSRSSKSSGKKVTPSPPPPPPPSEGGGSESESESESDDEEQLALEEEVVREKKEAHARYMRFHRSLSSFLDLISIHSVSCVVKNHHALRSKGSRGSQTKPGSNHDVEGIINDNVLGVFVRACMTISNVNFTRCMLHMMCAYSKEIGAHTLSCGLV